MPTMPHTPHEFTSARIIQGRTTGPCTKDLARSLRQDKRRFYSPVWKKLFISVETRAERQKKLLLKA